MCGREYHKLAAKKVSLCSGCNRGVVKYRFSFNTRSHGKITSPRGKSMRFKRMWVHTHVLFQSKMVLDIPNEEEEEEDLEKKAEEALTNQMVNQIKGIDQLV